jgi:hypothetical protein
MEGQYRRGGDSTTQRSLTGPALWRRLAVVLSVSAALGCSILYAAGLPIAVVVGVAIIFIGFMSVPFVTRAYERSAAVTPRRAIALFGVIPATAVLWFLTTYLLGVPKAIVFWGFPAVILLGNFAYWMWLDDGDSSERGVNGRRSTRGQ